MLELSSNKVKVLGIFGRLSAKQEACFDNLEAKYSRKPSGNEFSVFRHLTLTFIPNASVGDISTQLDLLKDLKTFLPLKIRVKRAFVKDEESMAGKEHIALEFDLSEAKEIVDFVHKYCSENTVATWYTKVVWFVPKEKQQQVIKELESFEAMEFTDFYLVSNKQDEANTIYTTQRFDQ